MIKYKVIYSSVVEKSLIQDYESVLNDASVELSEAELKHLTDIAHVGYEHAAQKEGYVEALHYAVSEWIAESRRAELHFVRSSPEIDFDHWYNNTSEVKKQMKTNQHFDTIPTFFVCFGAIVLALFCIFATVFIAGILQGSFVINPVYLFMFSVGFLGLLLTDVVAIAEWRKDQSVQK